MFAGDIAKITAYLASRIRVFIWRTDLSLQCMNMDDLILPHRSGELHMIDVLRIL